MPIYGLERHGYMSIFFIIISILTSAFILKQTLTKRLPERESVLWMLGCIVMILLAIFPKSMDNIAKSVGVSYPPSVYLLLAIMFLGLLIFRLMLQTEDRKRKSDELARKFALLEREIEELKQTLSDKDE